jgi:hypothetical protein
MKQYRHRRSANPSNPFPSPLEPGELAVNTANRQLAVGNADAAALGVPLSLIAIRYFDTHASYLANDMVVQLGKLYVAKAAVPPGPFNASQWTEFTGGGGGGNYLPLTGGMLTGPLGIGPVSIFPGALFEAGDKDAGTFTVAPLWVDMTTLNGVNPFDAASFYFGRSRGSSTVPAPVQTGDALGGIWWNANEGGDWANGAGLTGIVDGPIAVGSAPTALAFYTGDKDGGIERLRIKSSGASEFSGEVFSKKGIGILAPLGPYLTLAKPPGVPSAQNTIDGSIGTKTDWSDYKSRWQLVLGDATPETGANAGTNFSINRFADDGTTLLGTPLTIDRASGQVLIAQAPTQPSSVARKTEVDARVSKLGDVMTGDLTISKANPSFNFEKALSGERTAIYMKTGLAGAAKLRWRLSLSNGTAEAADGSGSDITFARANDAGTLVDDVITMRRADGLITVLGDPTAALGIATKQYVDAGVRAFNSADRTAYTLVLSDIGKIVALWNSTASPLSLTVPPNSAVAFAVGAEIDLMVTANIIATIVPGAGVSITSEDSKRKLPKIGSCATLVKVTTDGWVLCGSLIA